MWNMVHLPHSSFVCGDGTAAKCWPTFRHRLQQPGAPPNLRWSSKPRIDIHPEMLLPPDGRRGAPPPTSSSGAPNLAPQPACASWAGSTLFERMEAIGRSSVIAGIYLEAIAVAPTMVREGSYADWNVRSKAGSGALRLGSGADSGAFLKRLVFANSTIFSGKLDPRSLRGDVPNG